MKLTYFAHDLADAAVHRRVRMLGSTAEIQVVGFRRAAEPITEVAGRPAVDLGRTYDARLAHRAGSVLNAALGAKSWHQLLAGTDVFLARQLEMLALAAAVRRRVAPQAPLVFECLDIHRLMLSSGVTGMALRALERRLLHASDMLVLSSPGFVSGYFEPTHPPPHLPPTLLLENKVLSTDIAPDLWPEIARLRGTASVAEAVPAAGPPWRIGWYGVIRCQRSLQLLAGLLRALPGQVEVIIRGRPSRTALPDFDAVISANPGMRFLGPYDRATELAQIYRDVHFTWTLDFYEAPGNSEWLLPNRLYEGTLFGCVPLALRTVETGRWLARRNCGILLDEDLGPALARFFRNLDAMSYTAAREKVGRISLSDLVDDPENCAKVVSVLAALRRQR